MTPSSLLALAVDDSPADAELLKRSLQNMPDYHTNVLFAMSGRDAEAMVSNPSINVIFVDYILGAETGLDVIKRLRSDGELRPIIALTGNGNESVARDLMCAGADDYLAKSEVDAEILRRSIDGALSRSRQRQLQKLNEELTDALRNKNRMLKRQNEKLRHINKASHEFVENLSHDFRTPLTVIKEFAAILKEGLAGEVSAEQKEYCETILDRVDDLAHMIEDMLDSSKLRAGMLGIARRRCTVYDIAAHVCTVLTPKADTNHINLAIDIMPQLPPVFCDPEKISRVVINLANNAMKVSEESATVTIWARRDEKDGLIRMGVTDQGPGIEADKVSTIFERFQQAESTPYCGNGGVGLGLNIAKELVRMNCGEFALESEVAKGSTFSFTVPCAEPRYFIRRYLDHLAKVPEKYTYAALVEVGVLDEVSDEMREEFEKFLHHEIRCYDVVFPRGSKKWVIVLVNDVNDNSEFSARFRVALRATNRNRPVAPFPSITVEVYGTWSILVKRDEFIREFECVVGDGVLDHVQESADSDH